MTVKVRNGKGELGAHARLVANRPPHHDQGMRLARSVWAFAASMAALCAATAALAEPRAVIEGVDDRDLRARIERAVGEVEGEPGSRFEARRRVNDAAERATALLRSEGYYGAVVEPTIGEGEDPPWKPIVRITPGQRFTFQSADIAFSGEAPAAETADAARASLGVNVGAPGRAADVLEAEGRAVAVLQTRGYADAKVEPREVVVDHADASVRPTFRIASGPLVRLNGIDIEEIGRTDPTWLKSLRPWRDGQVYDPDDVAELERRLLDTGVYDSVTVALAPQSNAAGFRPVIVSLSDRPRRTLEALASVSTSEGVSIEGRRTAYNRFGRADTLTQLLRLGTLDSRLEGELSLPHFRRPQRTLTLGGAAFATQTEAFDENGVNVRADITQRFGKVTFFTYGARVDLSQTAEFGAQRNFLAVTGLGAFNLDRSSDPLDPRSGYRIEGRVEPTALTGDSSLVFLRTVAQGSVYLPFGEEANTVIAGRVRLGLIAGGQIPDVPASRRFYAGGGGSVRGYEFQAVGPRAPDGKPFGGLSLAETSIELRRSNIFRRLGGVIFFDAGSVGPDEAPSFDELRSAIGFGARYDLGFGPIRADLAIPLNKVEDDAPFQVYLSIGQAF